MNPVEAYNICLWENKRIKQYEPIILKNVYYSYYYALFVIKGRWPEAEYLILKYSVYSFFYALNVVNDRWIEAEPVIRENSDYWKLYCNHFRIQEKYNWKLGL